MSINGIKDFLSFSRAERNGTIILLLILIAIIVFPGIYHRFIKIEPFSAQEIELFKTEIDSFMAQQKKIESENYSKYSKYSNNNPSYSEKQYDYNNISKSTAQNKLNPSYFNPNNLPEEKWKEIGLSEKQIKTIKNYEAKGGKFYDKEDFKKMYCISDAEYQVLEPYIIIPKEEKKSEPFKTYTAKSNETIIDINTADTLTLTTLRGIGPSFARRIVKYRNALGGFYAKEQLLEVWGFTPELFASIENNITISNQQLQKININKANIDELKKHPYIDYYIANAIVKYRAAHGAYHKPDELLKIELIHTTLYNKLFPYIEL